MLILVTLLLALAGGWTVYRKLSLPKIADIKFDLGVTPTATTTPKPTVGQSKAVVTIVIGPTKQTTPMPTVSAVGCYSACGDDECEDVVCEGKGCPCAETAQNCPRDCK